MREVSHGAVRFIAISLTVIAFCSRASAVTLPELASQVASMSRSDREALLVKGAKQEKEVMRALSVRRSETLLLAASGNFEQDHERVPRQREPRRRRDDRR
jgi:hypothetical protein